jgi:hypothetical protein
MHAPGSIRHLSQSIACPLQRAYDFLCVPEHFCHWASGLASGMQLVDGQWLGTTPQGKVRLTFSPPNAHGVLDHWVHITPQVSVYVPLRLVANGDGCELILSLFRQPGMSDERFEADAQWVMRDLLSAKQLLEALNLSTPGIS